MDTKKHPDHPHLTGEYKWGDRGQLILLLLFLLIWITDSFLFHYSTFLTEIISNPIRLSVAGLVLIPGWLLARGGMKAVFGTVRSQPELIQTGVFRIVRHPIYLGALLFYLAAIVSTLSIASAGFWIIILLFYGYISKYEERILIEEFGDEYLKYRKRVGMLFPKII
jgi:protein-S-isoprenylcysteine O-methyltransferase Ste14